WLGTPFYYQSSLPSTNDLLKEMAEQGSPAGTMVLTDFQLQGKGRLGRRWEAPPETSLLVSLLFRPNWPAQQATWLTMIAGLAAVSAVRLETNLLPSLKWPNDLVLEVDGTWHKFGGLLLESHFENDRLAYAILGSGLNVNVPPDALPDAPTPATSLLAIIGRPINRLSLLNTYLRALEGLYKSAEKGQSPLPAWREWLITLGKPVRVSGQSGEQPIEGTAEDVDEWGRLLVREDNGRLHTLAAGDVTLRPGDVPLRS
ncbi:MAG: biotin--[acetyl-CoA-carboxylase] ligase, partial [Candidatus Promineifilaceae bacterium]